MPFVSSLRGTFGPTSENRGVGKGAALSEFLRQDPNSPAAPTGGTITTAGGYRIHTFTNVGNTTFSTVSYGQTLTGVEYLIVAGGGSGGRDMGGGGGAGGLLTGSISLVSNSYSLSVGGGAPAFTNSYGGDSNFGSNGSNTTGLGLTAVGGGRGASNHRTDNLPSLPAASGGSGGGASGRNTNQASGTAGQGNGGGSSTGEWFGGGGGGAGGAGLTGSGSQRPDGGPGLLNTLDGNSFYYAAGGGGNAYSPGPGSGNGGLGGGGGGAGTSQGQGGTGGRNVAGNAALGNASNFGPNGTGNGTIGGAGAANTGSGGGGAAHSGNGCCAGMAGGSGIVIIRYPI